MDIALTKTKTKDQTQIMTVTTVTMGVLKMASSRKPVLTKKDYLNSILRSYVLQNAQNYGTMQGTGMANSIMPQLRKIYKDDDAEFKRVTTSNLEFYNTNPQPYPFVTSIMLAM
ncbi:PTS system mannose/fructose/sorbose family transporter subunit IID, partial [Lacticaseibacillus rhamnosus]|uniref:PTS system mannose/fructose/sorbose family transporter subunit IID n=1 Tax=Lacticaseibacillus rhamnosus TaxID=47715 RepID=UPI00296B2AC5